MGAILAVANHKGGTAKTTTVRTLGEHFAEGGYRTLLIDLDPQSTLTDSCGFSEQDAAGRSLAEIMGKERLSPVKTIRQVNENLFLVPASYALASISLALAAQGDGHRLRQIIRPLSEVCDIVIIDCPPDRGLLTTNALIAADGVLCPSQPNKLALKGLKFFIENSFEPIKEKFNLTLDAVGIVPTFYDGRLLHHQAVLKGLKDLLSWPILYPIGRTVRIEEAAALGQTVLTHAPDHTQARAYRKLGRQVEQWLVNTLEKKTTS